MSPKTSDFGFVKLRLGGAKWAWGGILGVLIPVGKGKTCFWCVSFRD